MRRAVDLFSGLPKATESLVAFAEPFIAQLGLADAGEQQIGIAVALQEIINDLYDGFLSQEDRRKLVRERGGALPALTLVPKPPRVEIAAADALVPSYDSRRRVIEFPVWLAQPDGVLAWVSLAHETCGHAILDAYGLLRKLRAQVRRNLSDLESEEAWRGWFEEAASDCLGVLNMGPAMALGSIASWRAHQRLVQAEGKPRLGCVAFDGPKHPPPALRAYLMAHVTGWLRFEGAKEVSAALKREVKSELEACRCGQKCLRAAEVFAETLLQQPQSALNGFCFLDLQNWQDRDEAIARELRQVLRQDEFPRRAGAKHYAAHAVAAAILESVSAPGTGDGGHRVLPNLVRLLRLMHDSERSKRARRELSL